jgi:hypothetical protein
MAKKTNLLEVVAVRVLRWVSITIEELERTKLGRASLHSLLPLLHKGFERGNTGTACERMGDRRQQRTGKPAIMMIGIVGSVGRRNVEAEMYAGTQLQSF